MSSSQPLSAYPLADTGNAEELMASFARFYGRPVIDFAGRDRSFRAIINHCKLQHIELNYGTYGGTLNFDLPESGFESQVFALHGSCEAIIGGRPVQIDHNVSLLIAGDVPLIARTGSDYRRLTLCVRSASLTRTLAALTGQDIAAPLAMAPTQSVTTMPGRLLRDQVTFLAAQLNTTELSPVVLAEFEQALLVTFLRTNRHNYSHLFEATAPETGLMQVRRTEEYIVANAGRPLTLDDLAAVSGVSVLSLFRSFRAHRGYSPLDFLRQTRAHARLPVV